MIATKAESSKSALNGEARGAWQRAPGAASIAQTALGNTTLAQLHESQLSIQRSCCSSCAGGGPCEEQPGTSISRRAADAREVDGRLPPLSGTSAPLDAPVLGRMEAAFGAGSGFDKAWDYWQSRTRPS